MKGETYCKHLSMLLYTIARVILHVKISQSRTYQSKNALILMKKYLPLKLDFKGVVCL